MKYNILEVHYNGDDVKCITVREFKFNSYEEALLKVKAYITIDNNCGVSSEYHIVCVKED
jgi:hypothetical protein